MTTATNQPTEETQLHRLNKPALDFEAALHSALEEMGEKFGLYDIMAQSGPITPACLATQAGIPQRVAQVWLDSQAAENYLKHYATTGLYCLWSSWPRMVR
jgi:hypothetical protein